MPLISEFFGLKVYMYWNDHNPPHFHVQYAGKEAVFNLDGDMIEGFVPKRQKRMVQVWIDINQDALYENWKLLQEEGQHKKIKPLS